jgi:sigma54-dependent transcription regulator
MATHDYIIGNQGFPAFRSDLNDVLAAIVSNNSSATEPATKYAYMMWYDSTTNIWKMRNAANDAWISLATFDQATNTVNFLDSSVSILGLATSATGTVLTLTDTHLDSTVSQLDLPDATSYCKMILVMNILSLQKTASAVNEVSVTNNLQLETILNHICEWR